MTREKQHRQNAELVLLQLVIFLPLSECLKDTVERCLPYWEESITPALKRGKVRAGRKRRPE